MLILIVAAELFEPLLIVGAVVVLLATISLAVDSIKGRRYALVGIALESLGFFVVGVIISPVSLMLGAVFTIMGAVGASLVSVEIKKSKEKRKNGSNSFS